MWEEVSISDFIIGILVFSLPLTFIVSLWLLWRYRKRMAQFMQQDSGYRPEAADRSARPNAGQHAPLQLNQVERSTGILKENPGIRRTRWKLTFIYLLAGSLYAVGYTEVFKLAAEMEWFYGQTTVLFFAFSFPAFLVAIQLWVRHFWAQGALAILLFFLPYLIFSDQVELKVGPEDYAFVLAWNIFLPYIVYGLVRFRQYRAIGPFVWLLIFGLLTVFVLGLFVAATGVDFDSNLIFLGFFLLGLGIIAGYYFFARWMLRTLVGWYQRKQNSDWIIQADIIFLLFSISHFILLFENSPSLFYLGILLPMGYKVIQMVLMRVLIRPPKVPPRRLLLLRVFGNRGRSERLLDRYLFSWRFQGPIHMISGTDLAAETIEPHEFLAFLGGNLNEIFVKDDTELQTQLSTIDEATDPDGRYRVNDFFCFDNIWKEALHALLERSDYVLMDLRGFGPDNRGCIFEIEQLLEYVPLERLAFLYNKSTNVEFMRSTFHSVWESLPAGAINLSVQRPTVNFYRDARLIFPTA